MRINRWLVAVALMGVLGLLILPKGPPLPVDGQAQSVVRQGVTLLEYDFSGKTEREARVMLGQMADAVERRPVDAHMWQDATGTAYVTPDESGRALDVEMTWLRLAMAPAGSKVEPVVKPTPAVRKLADFPQSIIRQGSGEKKAITILINVDWGTPELRQMLPILKKKGAKATFFVSGTWASANANLLRAVVADGHEVATHGHNLGSGPLDLAAAGRLKDDIQKSVQTIESITGKTVHYYAPHRSETSAEIVKTAADLKLRTVLYSVDTVDWMESVTPERILAKFAQTKPGDLILTHPKPNTVKALEKAIDEVQGRGLSLITLTEMLQPS